MVQSAGTDGRRVSRSLGEEIGNRSTRINRSRINRSTDQPINGKAILIV
jgi:hypothetical protein